MHGRARRARIGDLEIVLYPLYHPAAALYNARLRPELEADIARIPDLLHHLDGGAAPAPAAPPAPQPAPGPAAPAEDAVQLGLF